MQMLIVFLIFVVAIAILGWALYWVCIKFFPNFPPALWICGVILLIVILFGISKVMTGGGLPYLNGLH